MKSCLLVLLFTLCASANQLSPGPRSSPFTRNSKARSTLMPGDVVEGDIMLDRNTASMYRGESRNAMKNVKLWPNGRVPYILDSSVDDYLRQQIELGAKEYEKYTCIRLVPRTNEKDYIRVVKPSSGCNSMVGVVGGEQVLNMGPGCEYVGLVLHEFGHAIGYFHEHNRPDRDDTVKILWENIQSGFKDAFYKYTFDEADTQGFPYDLTSIMHYENGAFSGGYCKPTMLVKANYSYEVRPVFKRKFSPQDVKKINKLYGCQTNELPPVVSPGTNNPDPAKCPCEDLYDKCKQWKDMGECGNNLSWMSNNCPKSCRTCGEPPSDCQDSYPVACETWGKDGECDKNPMWMSENCKNTCNTCIVNPGECKDRYQKCSSWSTEGECSTTFDWMNKFCAKSCRVCGEPDSDCQDKYPVACDDWGQEGECQKNPAWMGVNCNKTCAICGGGTPPTPDKCRDLNRKCPSWSSSGECSANFEWMHTNCPKSCKVCGEPDSDCKDAYPVACSDWGKQGECNANPAWMGKNCPVTCGTCNGGTIAPPVTTSPPNPSNQPTDCKDVYPQYCPGYKQNGMCETHPDYTKEVCKYTCGYCGGGGGSTGNCRDVYPQHCPSYKQQGMCTDPQYIDYVKQVCKFTCGFCN